MTIDFTDKHQKVHRLSPAQITDVAAQISSLMLVVFKGTKVTRYEMSDKRALVAVFTRIEKAITKDEG